MKYNSTCGQTAPMILVMCYWWVLRQMAGLMLPEHYPTLIARIPDEWRTLSYPQLAMAIMQRFATGSTADLQDIIERTYTAEIFVWWDCPCP